jgi:hypothetical protein
MKIVAIKSSFLFFAIVLLAFSFPLQVMTSTPLMALLPYMALCFLFFMTLLQGRMSLPLRSVIHSRISLFVLVYIVLLFMHTSWQAIADLITVAEAVSVIMVFGFPVLFFIYFRFFAIEWEFRVVFYAIFIVAIVSGTFYVYDSYSMMVLGKVSNYSVSALNYISMRAPDIAEHNVARVSGFYRSHGLLEKHSISSAWLVLGCFAGLSILPKKKQIKRMILVVLFGLMLLIAQNATSLMAYIIVIILIEYGGYSLLRGVISKRVLSLVQVIMFGLFLIGFLLLIIPESIGGGLFTAIRYMMSTQFDIATGSAVNRDTGYFEGLIINLKSYLYDIGDFPASILFGDGFSTFGYPKGGDYGVIETIHRFGVPFFLAILIGLTLLINRFFRQIDYMWSIFRKEQSDLWFALSTTVFLILTEMHYTVWSAKSILPIFFMSLAIFDRYRCSSHSHCTPLLSGYKSNKFNWLQV